MSEFSPELEKAVDDLVGQIIMSKEYSRYQKQKEILRDNPSLREDVDRIRHLSEELRKYEDDDSAYDEYERIENEYEELYENRRVHDFIQAETDFIRQFQDIYARIVSGIDFDL